MNIKEALLSNPDIKSQTIMSALKKCFYAEHKPDEEARMVKMIQLKNGESRERYGLHGSAILKDDICMRAQVLSLLFRQQQGEELPLDTLAIFEEGNAIHEKWQRLFIRGDLGTKYDMDVTQYAQGYELLYTPDAIITINGTKYIVEIKSMNTFLYQKSSEHKTGALQCLLYMYLTNIRNGFVLMENKNTQEFKIQLVEYDEQKIQPIIERLKEIQKLKADFIKTKKPPKRICENAECEQAEKCVMRDCCFNINGGRKSLFDKDYLLETFYSKIPDSIKKYYDENYSKDKDKKAFAEWLKKTTGTCGGSWSGIIEFYHYSGSGLELECKRMNGEECEVISRHYTWNNIADKIIEIIER
jgi:CRISPR/Cas system-associated exonuclease Cas4 (RecB family)